MTYKKKSYLLIFAIIVMLLACYKLSISHTINLINEKQALTQQLAGGANIQNRISYLKEDILQVEHLLGTGYEESEALLLESLSLYCKNNNVLLREFPMPVFSDEHDIRLITYVVVLEGPFQKLLGFLYESEKNFKGGRVSSCNFMFNYDSRLKKEFLTLKIIIQSVYNG